ncbi:MAG: hypothetical protein ACOX3U_01060 [Christensenellales bacterium]
MLYLFIGPSCTGKAPAAEKLKTVLNADVITGKKFIIADSDRECAFALFRKKLTDAATGNSIIYVIGDIDIVRELNVDDIAVTIRFTADLELIKRRFATKMNGFLPDDVAKTIEKCYYEWLKYPARFVIDTTDMTATETADSILDFLAGRS